MQLKYKYFYGGDYNPYKKEAEEAYRKLTEERKIADPENMRPTEMVFPILDSWANYVIAESKSTFWQMERAIGLNSESKASEIETIWKEAVGERKVDKWIVSGDGDEAEKAICYYMKVVHGMFAPGDRTVDFRLYFSEGGESRRLDVGEGFSLDPYEG
ncbi:MAG: hypothetical protein J6Q22_09765 [Prevotella sp.]|nr:hypothetical protein [Prevotella sp.]